jgi:hypothetical protein
MTFLLLQKLGEHKKEITEKTKSLTLLNYFTTLYQLYSTTVNYVPLVSMITSRTITTVVKQGFQLWDPLLYKYGFNCHARMVWLPWLPNLTLDCSQLTSAGFYTDLRSLKLLHFKMVEAMGLRIWLRGHLQCHYLPTKFHGIYQSVQKLLVGTQTDRQTGDLISLYYFWKVG